MRYSRQPNSVRRLLVRVLLISANTETMNMVALSLGLASVAAARAT